jgi:hypothetical protein
MATGSSHNDRGLLELSTVKKLDSPLRCFDSDLKLPKWLIMPTTYKRRICTYYHGACYWTVKKIDSYLEPKTGNGNEIKKFRFGHGKCCDMNGVVFLFCEGVGRTTVGELLSAGRSTFTGPASFPEPFSFLLGLKLVRLATWR